MFIKFCLYCIDSDKETNVTHSLFHAAFHTPLMKYEKNTESFLVCSILSVYPYPRITWKTDNTNVSGSSTEATESPGPFYVKSTLNVTGLNSSCECVIENSLLNETWRGQWTLAGRFHWTFCVEVLCQRLG